MENEDYLLTKLGEQHLSGTKYLSEFTLVFDMAKELSMVEKIHRARLFGNILSNVNASYMRLISHRLIRSESSPFSWYQNSELKRNRIILLSGR
jgi:phage anti-repressor protein